MINEQIAGWLKNVHSVSSVICTATQLFVEVKRNRWIRPEGSNLISANTEESRFLLLSVGFFFFRATRASSHHTRTKSSGNFIPLHFLFPFFR